MKSSLWIVLLLAAYLAQASRLQKRSYGSFVPEDDEPEPPKPVVTARPVTVRPVPVQQAPAQPYEPYYPPPRPQQPPQIPTTRPPPVVPQYPSFPIYQEPVRPKPTPTPKPYVPVRPVFVPPVIATPAPVKPFVPVPQAPEYIEAPLPDYAPSVPEVARPQTPVISQEPIRPVRPVVPQELPKPVRPVFPQEPVRPVRPFVPQDVPVRPVVPQQPPSRPVQPVEPEPDAEPVLPPVVSNFKCEGLPYGYYADEEYQCTAYHHCVPIQSPDGTTTYQKFSHHCSPGSVFSQDKLVCVHPAQSVPCADSELYHGVNNEFGKIPPKKPEIPQTLVQQQQQPAPIRPQFAQHTFSGFQDSHSSGSIGKPVITPSQSKPASGDDQAELAPVIY